MASLLDEIVKGSTDVGVTLRIIDSADGTPETDVVYNTSGIDLWYRREGGAKVSITEADLTTPALTDAHADGGFLHISDGEYRLDLPDAAVATGARWVDVGGTVTDMIVIGGRIKLVDAEQTGDAYAIVNSGTHGLAALKTIIDAIKTITDTLTPSGIRGFLGLSTDNLDTQLSTIYDETESKAEPGDEMDITDGAITSVKFTVSAPSGVATGILEKIDQLWRRFFKRTVRDETTIKTYADNGTTVLTTQTYTSVDPDDDIGAAT